MSNMAIAVIGSGMVSAVGLNAPATWAAIRAKLSGLRQETLTDQYSGEPISIGRAPLPQWWQGIGKYADLLAPAVLECLKIAEQSGLAPAELAQVPLVLALPELGRTHRPANLETELIAELEHRLGPVHPDSSVISNGRCGGVYAIDAAATILRKGTVRCCIVAGVDSYVQLDAVRDFVDRRRVVTPDNSNGFFPGEAGAAVLLTAGRGDPLGELHLLGLGVGHEPATIESDLPLRADGLCAAIRAAITAAGMTTLDLSYRLTDLNGERYKFKESTLAIAKLDRKVDALGREAADDRTLELWHPIEYLGEICPSWMSQLAEHVLPDPKPYRAWLEGVVERLEKFYPFEYDEDDFFLENDFRGERVPRELFDLSQPFDPKRADQLLGAFLRNIEQMGNPLLRDLDELVDLWDDEATPYRWPPSVDDEP